MFLRLNEIPTWYALLIAYTAILGLIGVRHQVGVSAALKNADQGGTDAFKRGQSAGQRARGWSQAASWLVAAGLLLTLRGWAITSVAVLYGLSIRTSYRDYAIGFAEGYKAEELAAAPEYVRGRIQPTSGARAAALIYVIFARVIPLGAVLVARTWLGR